MSSVPKQSKDPSRERPPRPPRQESSKGILSKTLILDITKRLMLEEGYAAVSTRRVAKEAGMKGSSIHYYFPTTDDLFIELFRREATKQLELLDQGTDSEDPLLKIWHTYQYSEGTPLHMEFMALANHRKVIKREIARYTNRARKLRAEALSRLIDMERLKPDSLAGEGLAVLMIGVARTLVSEKGLGISRGHKEARAAVEWWLNCLKDQNT